MRRRQQQIKLNIEEASIDGFLPAMERALEFYHTMHILRLRAS
jgi:hypothetical protein